MREGPGDTHRASTRLRQAIGAFSVLAPILHRLLGSAAEAEQWLFNGVVFGALLSQGIFGLAVMLAPWRYNSRGSIRRDFERLGRPYYRFGLVGNTLLLLVYLLVQTIGAPADDPLTILRFLPDLIEVVLIIGFAVLLRRGRTA